MNIKQSLEKMRGEYATATPQRREALTVSGKMLNSESAQLRYMGKIIWRGGHYVEGYAPKPEQQGLDISDGGEENPLEGQWEALQRS